MIEYKLNQVEARA